MTRYFAASDLTVRDSANENRPVERTNGDGPMVFGTVEDAVWYAGMLNDMHRPDEIEAMCLANHPLTR